MEQPVWYFCLYPNRSLGYRDCNYKSILRHLRSPCLNENLTIFADALIMKQSPYPPKFKLLDLLANSLLISIIGQQVRDCRWAIAAFVFSRATLRVPSLATIRKPVEQTNETDFP